MIIALQNSINIISSPAFWLGILVGIPIAYPGPPYYWLAFITLVLALPNIQIKRVSSNFIYIIMLFATVIISLTSNLLSPYVELETSVVLTSSLFFVFFGFGFCIRNPLSFYKGYTVSMNIFSVAIIVLFFVTKQYAHGWSFFYSSELRMWGYDIFPDWPNYLCFGLGLAFLVNIFINQSNFWAIINLTAGLMTTSRMVLLAFGIYIAYVTLNDRKLRLFLLVSLLLLTLLASIVTYVVDDQLLFRIMKVEDRLGLFNFLVDLVAERPFLGHGSIRLDIFSNELNVTSFHNSYLEILVRHGFLTFVIYIYLLWPRFNNYSPHILYLSLYFLISAMVQNIFKHPHYAMAYSVLLFFYTYKDTSIYYENCTKKGGHL